MKRMFIVLISYNRNFLYNNPFKYIATNLIMSQNIVTYLLSLYFFNIITLNLPLN